MGRLEGKVAIITGGARGMGLSHAELFIKEGAKVVITDVLEDEGVKAATRLGSNCMFMRHDVSSRADWERVVKETEAKFGPVSVLVNNAGIAKLSPWDQTTDENYDLHYRINQLGVYLGMVITAPSMFKAKKASIINISSIAGMAGSAGSMPYVASKFAVRGMTKAAANDFGPKGIRVNSVHPGVIRTPMTMDNPNVDRKLVEQMGAANPLGRIADPIEVSNLVLFLASDESSFSTGSEFVVDGGQISHY
jgi:3alpha(or 20beta)-hydroxysteroid dehydrogenase